MAMTPRSDEPLWDRIALLALLEEQADRPDVPGEARLMLATAAAALRTAWETEDTHHDRPDA